MTIYNFFVGLSCVFLISAGQILFKLASKNINFEGLGSLVVSVFSNFYLIFGFILYVFTTFMWLSLLKVVDLKLAYPIMALAFIIVPILASVFLSERFGLNTLIGGILIVLGIVISVR